MCFRKPKCNWCGKRKDCLQITFFCKWYGLHICDSAMIINYKLEINIIFFNVHLMEYVSLHSLHNYQMIPLMDLYPNKLICRTVVCA